MLNPLAARCAPIVLATVLAAACTRQAPPVEAAAPAAGSAPGSTAASAATASTADAAAVRDPAALAWAQQALARNPGLELVATDPAGIFTVRMRHGGELRTIRMDELIAVPAGGATVEEEDVAAPEDGAAAGGGGPADIAAAPASGAITVTREAGRLQISGPGVSIASADGSAPAGGADAAAASAAPGAEAAGRQVERRGEPIVCQGGRLLRIDNRVLEFEGDGLVVEDGCDLYLTNSRIGAGGTAITVTRAKVHIVNSDVRGVRGSIDASKGSQVFMTDTSIDGLQRRFDTAQINDLGGNRYR
ncbi:MAG: hypothetical protein KF790_02790 [Steroidobacteraceae bacterium]|nr:hypothetical protein [Steroidobacteraceae bacterium]MCW5573167.1 hypothetical protein [Steroidobacteraceae bacterium]